MRLVPELALAAALLAPALAVSARGAAPAPLEVRDFALGKNDVERVVVEVSGLGTLTARVHVHEPLASAPVRILLVGPDGVEAEKKGPSPLRLRFEVAEAARIGSWRVEVANVGRMARLAGRLEVDWQPAEPAAAPQPTAAPEPEVTPPATPPVEAPTAAPPPPPSELTDGRILTGGDRRRLRAVCRDRNEDLFVRVDLETGRGVLYLRYRPVAELAANRLAADGPIELRGAGGEPMRLDETTKTLSVGEGEVVCKVRIYYGEPL